MRATTKDRQHKMATIFLLACIELLNACFPLDKRAAVSGKHTKIDRVANSTGF